MKNYIKIGLVAGALLAAVPAQAGIFLFNTVNEGTAIGSGNGNSFTYKTTAGNNTVSMKVSAWSLSLDRQLSTGTLASWGSDGLGIFQQGERTDGAYHQIDNVNGWEFAVLQFDQAVTLTSAVLNPFRLTDRDYTDTDAFIGAATLAGAWNRPLTAGLLAGLNPGFTANGFNTDSTTYANPAIQTFAAGAGNIWLIGGSFNGPDGLNDAFKLAQIGGSTVSAVPEPASWAMMLGGFALMGAALRRRRATAPAPCAA